MERNQKIKAFLNLDQKKIEIGVLATLQDKIYFKYNADFIESGIEISPFKLKLSNEILIPKETHFDGLFGVFSDSIPDGWGKLLLDRKLISKGLNINKISALDRLTYIDNNGMGAISYEPEYENLLENNFIDLDKISDEVEQVLQGFSEDVIEDLYHLGGSSGGARPKILVGFNENTNELMVGKAILPLDFEYWIIKFPATNDMADIGLIEFVYNTLAKNAGIEVNEFRLFKSKNGKHFFGSKRFDRIKNEKVHLHSVAGLLHDNFRMSSLDYGHIMDCGFRLEKNIGVYDKILKLAAFNVFAHNKDDHSKNFSFLMDKKGDWKFAPAYDLTFSNSSFGHHSTSVAGEYKNPDITHLMKLAKHFNVKNPTFVFDQVRDSISGFEKLANEVGVLKERVALIKKNL
jgi:serine/threonine-protein kinase HipA